MVFYDISDLVISETGTDSNDISAIPETGSEHTCTGENVIIIITATAGNRLRTGIGSGEYIIAVRRACELSFRT